MKKNLRMLLVAFVLCGWGVTAMGAEFQSIGLEALSMGGAGVASSRGSYAAYYNPALLAVSRDAVIVTISSGVGIRERNIAEHVDTLSNIEIDPTFEDVVNLGFSNLDTLAPGATATSTIPISPALREDLQTIQQELRSMSEGNGLAVMPTASVGVQVKNYGFGVYGQSDIAASAIVDSQRLSVVVPVDVDNSTYYVEYDPSSDTFTARDQAYYHSYSIDSAMEAQTTTLEQLGVAYVEIPLAYGHQFEAAFGGFSFGGAIKIMPGRTYDFRRAIDTESADISEDLEDYEETSTTWGVDVGILFTPSRVKNLSLGLVLKNLNTPEFDLKDGGSIDIAPQARLGIAYEMMDDRMTLALDADLTRNEVLIPDYDAQYLGGGVDYHPVNWFSLRGGLMKNIQESDEGTVLTAGLAMGAKWFQIDLAGQYSLKTGEFDGNDIPRYGRAQLSFLSSW